ncbi:uncharacterized protein LOC112272524 [Brachypodium distachyon]|uniref:uncharacterized protein LOC112272524 n=1 Tax=Brachypodium distachyon TaxID=15368 RepID=UPI000D0DEA23|nr:uncharacterized protein LOC112272524 [Brachypodium distachyon]|eukprot:XP_024319387.1 uncharacterized protein LOC112272524 [Brachypodium distachyon]
MYFSEYNGKCHGQDRLAGTLFSCHYCCVLRFSGIGFFIYLHSLLLCYVDVLGIVTGVSELLSADVKGRVISMRIIRLTDTRHTAIVSLWRTNAERLDTHALVRLSEPEPVIVLIMGCTFRMQDAMISLLASFGSKICINIANRDVVALRNRVVGDRYSIEWIAERGRRYSSMGIENTNVVALAALIPHNAMVHFVVPFFFQ